MRRKTSSGAKRKAAAASRSESTEPTTMPTTKRSTSRETRPSRSAPTTRVARGGSQALATTSTTPTSRAKISLLAIDVDLAQRVDLARVRPLATVAARDL